MIRVTIEEFDDAGRPTRSVMRSRLEADSGPDDEPVSFGDVMAYAIRDFSPARIDLVIAEIINVAEFILYDFFAGRNDAIRKLENAADAIAEGWQEFDERSERTT